MLVAEDLWIAYGRILAVRGVSFTVNQGEAVALIGPNGAGKTTTLAAVAGLLSPRSGSIAFEGASIASEPPERIARRGIALVPEGRHIFGGLTVEENLLLGGTIRGFRRIKPELGLMLERFPILRTYLRSPAGMLSGGEQQQLAIARALLTRPKLLMLDEPSLGLGPLMVERVYEILTDLRERGVTILLVEQSTQLGVDFADRTYVLRTGRVQLEGIRAELAGSVAVEHAYFGHTEPQRS